MPTSTILKFFAKSPFKPLQQHGIKVYACCRQLQPFFEAVKELNWKQAQQYRQKILVREKQANAYQREIRLKLPSGLFMPVNRADMLELLVQQDRLANKVKDISGVVLGRKLTIPTAILEMFSAYLLRCLDATALANQVLGELDQLLTAGFRGKEASLVESMVVKIDTIEEDTDQLQVSVRKQLQHLEEDLNPIDVIFLYKVIEWVGDLADQALRVGHRIELMLAR